MYYDAKLCSISDFFSPSSISPEGSPSRQGISETEFMERIRERMAQEVGGYVSVFALFYACTEKKEKEQILKM